MGRALAIDLRERVVEAYELGEHTGGDRGVAGSPVSDHCVHSLLHTPALEASRDYGRD